MSAVPAVTVSANVVLRTLPPPVPVIVIVEVVSGVEAVVEMVTVVEHVGEHDDLENVACAPAGRPDALSVTVLVDPATRVTVTAFDTEAPRITERLPPLESEKSNDAADTATERETLSRIARVIAVRNQRDGCVPLRRRRGKGPPDRTSTGTSAVGSVSRGGTAGGRKYRHYNPVDELDRTDALEVVPPRSGCSAAARGLTAIPSSRPTP
ncbi:MAG TPA: hypothetical protein VN654_14265 [Vicinamibacterales bacterium]|nr:hypothetical protein [Vicinamibacterales bacterium]